MSESTEQQALVEWFRYQYPKYHLIAIPNGTHLAGSEKSRAIQMARLKREGLCAGVSDLFLCVPRGKYAGMFLEMKNKGKTQCSVSEDQQKWIEDMREAGYFAVWISGQDEARNIIVDYMKIEVVRVIDVWDVRH